MLKSRPTPPQRGADHLATALGLGGFAWAVLVLQQVALFARPSPYGGPYSIEWDVYFFHAVTFRLLAALLVSLPFLVVWLWRFHRVTERPWAERLHLAQLVLLAVAVAYDHADNEVMRFMGTHLTANFLRTYGLVGAAQTDVGLALLTDRGGPGLPLLILVAGPALLWWAGRWWQARVATPGRAWTLPVALAVIALPLGFSLTIYNLPRGRFRRERVQSAVLALVSESWRGVRVGRRPAGFEALVAGHQAGWLAGQRAGGWRFAGDTSYPLLRLPDTPSTPSGDDRWNVIYFQLESFRGWNVGHLRRDLPDSPTPFLDSLARTGAYWTRALSFGPPTISGFMAGHCSIPPHSRLHVTTTFTFTGLDCFPTVLRRHGWYSVLFSASDPDWDNQTLWIRRWYDEYHHDVDIDGNDRLVFERAAARIREIGATGRPFLATITSISNHYPFRNREPALDVTASTDPRESIRNTMHYTDDVVRDFVQTLAREPWFRHTLLIFVGDHGYNLGEHDGEPGQRNGFRESLWVPLVIHGDHPRLPRGAETGTASLLDVAPTIADLVGIREATAWIGHSLIERPPPDGVMSGVRPTHLFIERGAWSLVGTPEGTLHLFDATADPLQQRDLATQYPDTAQVLARVGEDQRLLFDYLLEAGRIRPADSTRTPLVPKQALAPSPPLPGSSSRP